MLVLTRRLGESITIGDNIRVVVMEIRGNQVRLDRGAARHSGSPGGGLPEDPPGEPAGRAAIAAGPGLGCLGLEERGKASPQERRR